MTVSLDAAAGPPPERRRRRLFRRVVGHRGLLLGGGILLVMLALALLAPLLAPHDPLAQNLGNRLRLPIWHAWLYDSPKATAEHLLGTDRLGRDYLSRLIHGSRISILIGLSTVLISGLIGTTLGVLAGYRGGRTDMVVSFLITARLSLPVILIGLAVSATFGSSLGVMIVMLGCLLWDRFAVVMRSVTRQIRDQDYIVAARALGCSTGYILWHEALPNVANALVVVATLEMAHAILLEAALSFLGLGVPPPAPSWGLMLAEARSEMFFHSWLVTLPGGALFLLVLAVNLMGDGIRDLAAAEGRA